MLAVDAIASGAADYVVLHRALHNPVGKYHENPMTHAEGTDQWMAPQGFWGPPAMIALPYNEYLQRYGARRESMAAVAVEARKNGARIPWSYWRDKPLTADEYVDARMIADPINVIDCDIPVDGAAAFVFTSAERARDLPEQAGVRRRLRPGPPRQPARADALDARRHHGRRLRDGPAPVGALRAVTRRHRRAPAVRRLLAVHLHLARGPRLLRRSARPTSSCRTGASTPSSGLPILSGGGAIGNGRMHGLPQMVECYLQLSRRAGDRQLATTDIGLACHSSPHYGGAVLYSAERL